MRIHFEKIGKEHEKELLGTLKSVKERKRLPDENFSVYLERVYGEIRYTKDHSFKDVKNLKSFSPIDPYPAFASDVYVKILDLLEDKGLISKNSYRNLEYYSAIPFSDDETNPLDLFFGIDAFFEFKYQNKIYQITIDLKTKFEKNIKADILHQIPNDFVAPITYKSNIIRPNLNDLTDLEFKEYIKHTEDLANQTVDVLINKIKISKP